MPNTAFGAYAIDQKEIEYVSNKPFDLPPDRYVLVKSENPEETQVIKSLKMRTFYPKSEGDAVQRNNSEDGAAVANGDYTSGKACLKNYSIGSYFSGSSCLGYEVTLGQMPDQFFVM